VLQGLAHIQHRPISIYAGANGTQTDGIFLHSFGYQIPNSNNWNEPDDQELPYFPVGNARVIYTKMFSKREKTTLRVIHKVRVMQLKSKKFQNT
jgi:hypothetical protein